MKFILGEKIGMTQIFNGQGNAVPVTLVRALPNTVTQVKTKEKDGYGAVQVGSGKAKNITKPQKGHFKELGDFRHVREFRIMNQESGIKPGDTIDLSQFSEGEFVKVSGVSKAKGFQGVVKRHGFHGAPATHGTKHAHREPGSIGGAGGRAGGRVAKGMRMAGRMGGRNVSVRNIMVAAVDPVEHLIALRGAVPGRRGTLLEIRG